MPAIPVRAIIHVDMDAFYASVEQQDHPELHGRPVIVGGLGSRGVVSAASYEARAFGVHSAMPMGQARSLCPGAQFLSPRMTRYREVSARIFGIFQGFTPHVEGLSLDEAFLDVSGSLKLFGDIRSVGRRLREEILSVTGLQASVGMAHNKFLAKLASDARKPAGFVCVAPNDVQAFLDPMPVSRLWGIGRKTEPLLRARGLLTIGQLRRCDERVLREVLGNRTRHFLALARGEDDREVESRRADKSISHEVTFDADLLEVTPVRAELQRQAEAVGRRMRHQHLAARTITLKIRDSAFRTMTRSLTLRAATASTQSIYRVARGLLSRWLEEHHNTPIRLVGVGVSNFEDCEPLLQQTGRPTLDQALDRITERFGEDSVGRALGMMGRLARRRGGDGSG